MTIVPAERVVRQRSVTAADQWTESLRMFPGELADVSVSGSFTATVRLERRLFGAQAWGLVKEYSEAEEDVLEAGGIQDVRIGVASGGFTSGPVLVVVAKG
ncbi:MAG: hypothetical protein EA405_13605 [Rhodospirillales bacterium]|nr:MAG: hypothetical protein EA405_13605 [Rhodospirillales bacterium]